MKQTDTSELPLLLQTEDELEELLTRPSPLVVESMAALESPLLVLGAGGKMGPTLAALARRAAENIGHPLEIIAVSRFSDPHARHWLEARGVRTIPADLMDRETVQTLPDTANLVYLVGFKFGASQSPALTWAINTMVPAYVCERFPGTRMVALSTGNVYPLVPVASGGATETTPLAPLGEYPNAAVARERIFEYHSQKNRTPLVLLRLNYAIELRYGVLVDIGAKVWTNQPLDLRMGYFNCIWQGDANVAILRSFALARTPPAVLNLTGVDRWSVRKVAEHFGRIMNRQPRFLHTESESALLSDAQRAAEVLGAPATPLDSVIQWTAHWIMKGNRTLGRPTHFEVRDGTY